MIVKLLAPAAVTGLLLSATVGAAPAAAQQVGLAADSSFIQMAGSLGLLQVKLGKSSVNTVEILSGLKVGDQVILSDMSAYDAYDRIRLK